MSAAESNPSSSTWCFSIFAAPEAGVTPRILDLFAKRGLVPARLHAAVVDGGAEGLVIDLSVAGLDADAAETIAARMRGLVNVERVLTAVVKRRVSMTSAYA